MPIVLLKILIALVMDQILGEPRRWHPLVGFGRLARRLEARLNHSPTLLNGALAWALAVLPWVILAAWGSSFFGWLFDVVILYLAIGRRSLFEHARRVSQSLLQGDLAAARHHTALIVSRDTAHLDASGCTRATLESVLENTNDSIIGALFWFALLGAPGAVLFRLANTLDAMWGYRTERFNEFGRCAARLDDLLNYLPARLCAFAFAVVGDFPRAMDSWRSHAHQLSSPNGGPVMCAGAGALNLQLGGPARYHGIDTDKPWFGGERLPEVADIAAAQRLVDRATALVVIALGVLAWL